MIPTVYFIGLAHRAEFQTPCHDIQMLLQHDQWNHVCIKRLMPKCPEMGILILLQSRPDEFSSFIIADFKKQNPLTPIILIAGACTESETRTGHTPSGCYRILASQWNPGFLHEMEQMLQKKPSLITLPVTYENDERIMLQNIFCSESPGSFTEYRYASGSYFCVLSHDGPFGNDSAMNHYLAHLCMRNGASGVVKRKEIDNTFTGKILADVDDSPFSKILKAVQRLRSDFADAEIELCINSPRINEINDLLEAGADKILPKPVFW